MELLLSQERVVSLLYDRTFPDRPHDAPQLGSSFAESGDFAAEEEEGLDVDVGF